MPYKVFVVIDPAPWFDQFVSTIGTMVLRCGGSSTEFVVNTMLANVSNPNHVIFGIYDEEDPSTLVAWVFLVYVHDTFQPWVEAWAFWCKPSLFKQVWEVTEEPVLAWARGKGAVRIMAIATRTPRVFFERFYKGLSFRKAGIVLERKL